MVTWALTKRMTSSGTAISGLTLIVMFISISTSALLAPNISCEPIGCPCNPCLCPTSLSRWWLWQGPFPETDCGDRYILSFICLFSGWPEAFPVPNKKGDRVALLVVLLEDFIPRHSCPEILLSDQGTEFCNDVVAILSKKMVIVRIRTSPYDPQTNGKCERLHRVLNDIIAKRVAENQLDWPSHIPAALYAIRTSVHTSSRHTPYFLVYGRHPKLPIDTLLWPKLRYLGEAYIPTMIQRLHWAYVDVKANLSESQARNQAHRDAGVELPNFEVGDKVFYANLGSHPWLSKKLANHWQPYFRMLEHRSPVNYLIKHLPTNTVKLVNASHMRHVPCDVEWDATFHHPEKVISPQEHQRLCRQHLVDEVPSPPAGIVPPQRPPARRQPVRSCLLSTPLAEAASDHRGVKPPIQIGV